MPGLELLALAVIAAAGWWWYDGLNAREAAVIAARQACEAEGLMLLDWTVQLNAYGFVRNENGRIQVRRTYAFEYSNTGNNRLRGSIVVVGREVVLFNLAQSGDRPRV